MRELRRVANGDYPLRAFCSLPKSVRARAMHTRVQDLFARSRPSLVSPPLSRSTYRARTFDASRRRPARALVRHSFRAVGDRRVRTRERGTRTRYFGGWFLSRAHRTHVTLCDHLNSDHLKHRTRYRRPREIERARGRQLEGAGLLNPRCDGDSRSIARRDCATVALGRHGARWIARGRARAGGIRSLRRLRLDER